MKYALVLVLALAAQLASANTIHCADIGEIYPDGDQLFLVYNDKMGFSDKNDMAYFISLGKDAADFRTSKWGALLTIPVTLLGNGPATDEITVFQAETAVEKVTCTVE